MNSFIAIKKGRKIVVSLDDKAIIERHERRVLAKARLDDRKDELKKYGYRIQHIGPDTIQGRRIERSEPVQRQRKVKVLGQWVRE